MWGKGARAVAMAFALLAALALVVAAVLLLTGGDDAAPVVIVAPEQTQVPQPTPADIRVQVSGAVLSPGVYAMSEDDRVMDAIAAAGGVQPGADLAAINLAQRVQDEARYHVPLAGNTPPLPASRNVTTPEAGKSRVEIQKSSRSSTLVDLNTASSEELETLPGIGPVIAGRIIAHREANGPFATVDAVQDVLGIGPRTLESIRPLVTVSDQH